MSSNYLAFLGMALIFLSSCKQQTANQPSFSNDNEDIDSAEYIAGDTISMNRESFDLDSFKMLKEKAIVQTPEIDNKKTKPAKKVKKPKAKLYPSIKFDQEVFTIGDITEGDVIDQDFEFENVGKAPLNIKKAEGTCGCTIPSYPFLSIEPGNTGTIGVTYNSVGKSGVQEPEILVYSDAKNNPISKLKLIINVLDKDQEIATDSLDLK